MIYKIMNIQWNQSKNADGVVEYTATKTDPDFPSYATIVDQPVFAGQPPQFTLFFKGRGFGISHGKGGHSANLGDFPNLEAAQTEAQKHFDAN